MMHNRVVSSTGHVPTTHTLGLHILSWDFLVSSGFPASGATCLFYHPASTVLLSKCRLVAVRKRYSTSRQSPPIITHTPISTIRLQLIHYALGDDAMSPQPTGNHSITTRSLPLFLTAIESNLVPPPTLLDGTSHPSSAPVVSH